MVRHLAVLQFVVDAILVSRELHTFHSTNEDLATHANALRFDPVSYVDPVRPNWQPQAWLHAKLKLTINAAVINTVKRIAAKHTLRAEAMPSR